MSPRDVAAWAFVLLGGACVIVALVAFGKGGTFSDAGAEVTFGPFTFRSIKQPIVLVLIGLIALALAGGFAVMDGKTGEGGGTGGTASGTTTHTTASSSTEGTTASTPRSDPDPGTCVITIRNPLATIHEEPDTFSTEISRVPSGSYPVEEIASGDFGSRWMRITASDRSGWLEDSTFNIDSKSAACP
jgi:hypothetical protein